MMSMMEYFSITFVNEMMFSLKMMLVLITSWLMIITLFVSPLSKNKHLLNLLLFMTGSIIILSFSVNSILSFYIFFEMSILPVLFLIMGWGYQPERVTASFYMFFYTLFGSLPLLMMIINMEVTIGSMNNYLNVISLNQGTSQELIFFSLAFLIKLPIYFSHLWLPKAHVEAPVSGSMILAGLMLKLGGLGFLYLNFSLWKSSVLMIIFITTMMGSAFLSLLIIRLTDIKVMIAYSSVVHMSLVYVCSFIHSSQGLVGMMMMMLCHGITSPGMFACANMMYERSHSRSSIINKGKMSTMPLLSLFWFLLIMMNFGGPFSINLMSEILLINSVNSMPLIMFIFVSLMCFFSAMYNLILYATLHQGVAFFFLKSKIVSIREALILSSLVIPGMLILLSFQFN